jgi:hypothetical protein
MARSDLLVNLVKAASGGDQRLLRSTVEAMVAEERGKQHNILADRLQGALATSPAANGLQALNGFRAVDQASKGKEFLAETIPARRFEDLVIPRQAQTAFLQLVEEQQRADLLRSHGLEPRHRVLLVGPPGNGKTSLAEAIAEAIAVPLLVVRYEALIASYLGETAARLKRVFDYARTRPCVLFFDEFDAVGKERGDTHETGEIKRVVTSLLMQMDDVPSYTVLIAATNHSELLDRAIWRRFQIRMELPSPSQTQVADFVNRSLLRLGKLSPSLGRSIARKLGAVSFAEAEQFCLDVYRRSILALGEASLTSIIEEQLAMWSVRVKPSKHATEQGEVDADPPNSEASKRR